MFPKLLEFQNKALFIKAMTNKIHELEHQSKTGIRYPYGNNEDFIVIGLQILEFYFNDYLLLQGFPKENSRFKKSSDIILLRQKLINDKYLAEMATALNLQNYLNVGNQKALKNNPKVLAETFKALVTAHYYDKFCDLEVMRDLLTPVIIFLLNKGESVTTQYLINNPKSAFLEFINSFKSDCRLKPKITLELDSDAQILRDNNQSNFTITLELDNILKVQKQGSNKREVEFMVYAEALARLKQQLKKLVEPKQQVKAKNYDELSNLEYSTIAPDSSTDSKMQSYSKCLASLGSSNIRNEENIQNSNQMDDSHMTVTLDRSFNNTETFTLYPIQQQKQQKDPIKISDKVTLGLDQILQE